ncbi:MAG: hypothetical protein QOG85_989 [Gaiellaceae bacterium]|nr:hypothetical protein [Gaiellaceae bacterium]
MSFAASARRVRDGTQPFGRRVACLHGCLEQFNVFGFHTTRQKLRRVVGAGSGWTEQQLLDALELLESAKQSWSTFWAESLTQQRALKKLDRNRSRPSPAALFVAWREEYLDSGQAETWLLSDAGDCKKCGHRLIHHGRSFCEACWIDPEIPWESQCRVELLAYHPD